MEDDDLEEVIIKIDRDLIISKEKSPTQNLPSSSVKSRKRTREEFDLQNLEEEGKAQSFMNDSNLSIKKFAP